VSNLSILTDEQVVQRFEAVAIDQGDAVDRFQISKVNRLFDKLIALREELSRRGANRRLLLKPLLFHDNINVRLRAALTLLIIAPEEARAALQDLADLKIHQQSVDASMTLDSLDAGEFKAS